MTDGESAVLTATRAEREALRADLVRVAEFAHQGGTGSPVTQHGRSAVDAVGALWANHDTLRERLDMLLGERDNLRERALSAEAEMQRLRNRVESLLAERGTAAEERQRLRERVEALEADTQAAQAALADEQNAHAMTYDRMRAAKSRLAAIRQRAEDRDSLALEAAGVDEATFAALTTREQWDWESIGLRCARFVIDGDEATEPEGLNPCPECTTLDGHTSKCSRGKGSVEPSTEEAFATVREELDALCSSANMPETWQRVGALLYLLERRTGAMGRAGRKVLDHLGHNSASRAARDELAAALTNAPPVFTLEEVLRELRGLLDEAADEDAPLVDADARLNERLLALRK